MTDARHHGHYRGREALSPFLTVMLLFVFFMFYAPPFPLKITRWFPSRGTSIKRATQKWDISNLSIRKTLQTCQETFTRHFWPKNVASLQHESHSCFHKYWQLDSTSCPPSTCWTSYLLQLWCLSSLRLTVTVFQHGRQQQDHRLLGQLLPMNRLCACEWNWRVKLQ